MCNHFKLPSLITIQNYLKNDLNLPLIEPDFELTTQDVFPKTTAPVLLFKNHELLLQPKSWGYSSPINSNKPIFNARIERFYQAAPSMWDKSFARQRCIIVAEEFFETSKDIYRLKNKNYHEKYAFRDPEYPLTLIAGIYDKDKFAMVTTAPNSYMMPIHNRMPLVLKPTEIRQWLFQNFTSLKNRENFDLDIKKLPHQNNLA
ncbi:SOS response-associated peptidase family protein [Lactobacillus sp. PSON]|uniref:SOS response-associated peptidase family protein n=1 Tax=Lactobacillus sp. PSON TaxID=3455454 RepID=UPI0040412950